MTDNNNIDPEQARLAIEFADAEIAFNDANDQVPHREETVSLFRTSLELLKKYRDYVTAKRIRDAEQELIKAALAYYQDGLGHSHVMPKICTAFNVAVEGYMMVKDKAP